VYVCVKVCVCVCVCVCVSMFLALKPTHRRQRMSKGMMERKATTETSTWICRPCLPPAPARKTPRRCPVSCHRQWSFAECETTELCSYGVAELDDDDDDEDFRKNKKSNEERHQKMLQALTKAGMGGKQQQQQRPKVVDAGPESEFA
jgi:hypothetical protein